MFTDHYDETLDNKNDEFAVKKISCKKKAEMSHIMDPPSINNTEHDKLKYEYIDQNSNIYNFQIHKGVSHSPVPINRMSNRPLEHVPNVSNLSGLEPLTCSMERNNFL